jgi:hypothetical protein
MPTAALVPTGLKCWSSVVYLDFDGLDETPLGRLGSDAAYLACPLAFLADLDRLEREAAAS